jgi:hypothetical protein
LVNERARIVNEVASVIQSKYDSKFENFVQQSSFDCPSLVNMIIREFSGFRDEAIYKGEQIFFYKRA